MTRYRIGSENASRGYVPELSFKPVEQLLDHFIHPGPTDIDPVMRQLIRRASDGVQPFEVRSIGGKRPSTVRGDPGDEPFERHVEPDGDAVAVDHSPILRVDKGSAA